MFPILRNLQHPQHQPQLITLSLQAVAQVEITTVVVEVLEDLELQQHIQSVQVLL
jgi:hypothetical protein